jgi:hypothetical protein
MLMGYCGDLSCEPQMRGLSFAVSTSVEMNTQGFLSIFRIIDSLHDVCSELVYADRITAFIALMKKRIYNSSMPWSSFEKRKSSPQEIWRNR